MIAAATRLSTPTVEWLPIGPTILLMGAALLILMVKSVARQRFVVAWPSITIACAGVVGSAWPLISKTIALNLSTTTTALEIFNTLLKSL